MRWPLGARWALMVLRPAVRARTTALAHTTGHHQLESGQEILAQVTLHKDDAVPVGAPRGPAAVVQRAFERLGGEQRSGCGSGLCVDEVKVEVVVAVGVAPARP